MRQRIRRLVIGMGALPFALSPLALTACEQDGPMEEAGEAADDAADDLGDAAEEAADEVDDAVDEVTDDR